VGSSWTTDAPYRETREAIIAAEREGVVCVEMEAAALYAYAAAHAWAALGDPTRRATWTRPASPRSATAAR
jgi:purine-nucleoside phosphorylase